MGRGILLVGHGTRRQEGNDQFRALGANLARRLPQWPVQPCFLELAEPDIQGGIAGLLAQGVREVAVLPLLLFAAAHAKRDIPRELDIARGRHPGARFAYGRVLGVQPALVQVCREHLARVEVQAPGAPPAETAVLLIGRGSSDPDANSDLCKVARLLWEVSGYLTVETAYSDVAQPDVAGGIRRCVALGARRVILLPYFLFRGVLMERLEALVIEQRRAAPEVQWLLAGARGMGGSNQLLDLVVERALQVWPDTAPGDDGCGDRTAASGSPVHEKPDSRPTA